MEEYNSIKSMSTLTLNDVLGVWINEDYCLDIRNTTVTLSTRSANPKTITESIIWDHIEDTNNKEHYHTIQLSENIYISWLGNYNVDKIDFKIKDFLIEFTRRKL